jgi:ABC-type transporter Mla subunit MlaD
VRAVRRPLLVAVLVAAAIGFAVGWFARIWSEPTFEDRMRDAAHKIQERARELAH